MQNADPKYISRHVISGFQGKEFPEIHMERCGSVV